MPENYSIDPLKLTPGTVIAVRYALYKHFAIISDCLDNGMPKLISISYRNSSVQEESWYDVVANRPIEVSNIEGIYPKDIVLACAKDCLKKTSDITCSPLIVSTSQDTLTACQLKVYR